MKLNLIVLTGVVVFGIACGTQRAGMQTATGITITNTSAQTLADKPVAIKRSSINNIPQGSVYPLLLAQSDTIAAQTDDLDGDGQWDELFFVINLKPKEQRKLKLQWVSAKLQFEKRSSVRFGKRMAVDIPVRPATSETLSATELPRSLGFQRYQTDGPTWENDKVGFRHYLDGRNSKDVFGKLKPAISPEDVGINAKGETEDNYHVMEPWGRDILAVGNSVGIGGVFLVQGDSVLRLGVNVEDKVNNVEQTSFNIVTEGPVRSAMDFTYKNWQPKPGGKSYNASERVSIWPGMYAYHNTATFYNLTNELVGIGIVNINAEGSPVEVKINDEWIALISHERHGYNKEWWIGLALVLPADKYKGYMLAPKTGLLSHSYVAKMAAGSGQPVSYYAVAGWELSDPGFKNPEYFKTYVVELAKQISAQVKVEVK